MSLPVLFLVGATHRTASFGFREKLSLGAEKEAALAAELRQLGALREFVILNTCNRMEIYGVGRSASVVRQVASAFCALRGVTEGDFACFGFNLSGREVVGHLLQVVSGLDSQILGETEIFGQVKRAYATAQARQSAGPVLNRLFQKAFQAGKHVRTNTGISTGEVSVANVGVDLARQVFGDLAETRLLLLGAGEMGEKSAKAFQSRGARQVRVANRSYERAAALANALGGEAIAFEEREARLAQADIVVCSTSSPNTILSLRAVREAQAARGGRPLLLIDLAMPRDIDAAVGGVENVFLFNLDDLAQVAAENRRSRAAEAEAGRVTLAPRIESLWSVLQMQLATAGETQHEEPVAALRPVMSVV